MCFACETISNATCKSLFHWSGNFCVTFWAAVARSRHCIEG